MNDIILKTEFCFQYIKKGPQMTHKISREILQHCVVREVCVIKNTFDAHTTLDGIFWAFEYNRSALVCLQIPAVKGERFATCRQLLTHGSE